MLDLIIGWVWVVGKELLRHQNESWRAEAALERRVLDEGLLDWI
jgi:hypothetical protein